MHELAHVVAHEETLDYQLVGNDAQERASELEAHANRQAAEWLVPQDQLQGFIRALSHTFLVPLS